MIEKIYIHYGNDRLEQRPKRAIRNTYSVFRKPEGLWASPMECGYSWKDWCIDNHYNAKDYTKFFKFKLKPHARILLVTSLMDIEDYTILLDQEYALDISNLYEIFDGMEVIMSENWDELHNSTLFYNWDCDSICIWNLDVVIPLYEKEMGK